MSSSSLPRQPRVSIWVVLVTAILVLGVIVWQQRDDGVPSGDDGSTTGLNRGPAAENASGLSEALSTMQDAWKRRDRNAFIDAAGDSSPSAGWAARTYDNLKELGVKSIEPRFSEPEMSPLRRDGTFEAEIEVSWVPGPASGLPARKTDPATVRLRVRPTEEGFGIESAYATDDPMPLWLVGSLDVTRQRNRVVARVDGGSDVPRLGQMLARSLKDVRRVHGKPKGAALVVVPRASAQASDIVGGDSNALSRIAAMTTTLDGSSSSQGPTAVVLNPDVFTPMNARAAQIVLTHETTHDVTGAATADAPLWVCEGYADYVALSGDRLDPTRSASQALAQVRRNGPPTSLPADDAFANTAARLGASYESAWMVFRMLGETYDDTTISQFYRRVLRGQSADVVARDVLGIGLAEITDQWQQYLEDWSRVAHPR